MSEELPHRRIRSFVRREGRMTPAQQRALDELWPHYGADLPDGYIDPASLFARRAPLHVEIGFGNGETLLHMARAHPEVNYLGIDVHRPGAGRLILKLHSEALDNVRVICADATEVFDRHLPAGAVDAVYVFFPDPWPKKRHHKRRLLQPAFIRILLHVMKHGGMLYLATDWQHYAEHMIELLSSTPALENINGRGNFSARFPDRPLTRFEQRGRDAGHGVWDLAFRRI